METFLTLCQTVARRSGTVSGTQPTAVTGQTGRLNVIVQFVADAWSEIQSKRTDWLWMNKEWTGPTIANTAAYTAAGLSISDHSQWDVAAGLHCYLTSAGQQDEWVINYVQDWDGFRDAYLRGTPSTGKPKYYSIRPNDSAIVLYPTPDAAYTLTGGYRKTNQTLAANSDEPEMPARFHEVIMYRALQLLHEYDEADILAARAERDYRERYRNLANNQTPGMILGDSIA